MDKQIIALFEEYTNTHIEPLKILKTSFLPQYLELTHAATQNIVANCFKDKILPAEDFIGNLHAPIYDSIALADALERRWQAAIRTATIISLV